MVPYGLRPDFTTINVGHIWFCKLLYVVISCLALSILCSSKGSSPRVNEAALSHYEVWCLCRKRSNSWSLWFQQLLDELRVVYWVILQLKSERGKRADKMCHPSLFCCLHHRSKKLLMVPRSGLKKKKKGHDSAFGIVAPRFCNSSPQSLSIFF